MFDLDQPWITVTSDPEDDYAMTVKHHIYNIEERVDLGPSPAWPSPDEVNDLVSDAVRRVLDKAWEAASGEPVTRREEPTFTNCICSSSHASTACPSHPTCQGKHELRHEGMVFALGHYQQMQIDLALQVLRDSVNSDGSFSFGAEDLANLDIATLADLQQLFASHGTVSIIRKEA